MAGPCLVDECAHGSVGHGYCNKHYKRYRAHGDPLHVEPKGPRHQPEHGCPCPYCGRKCTNERAVTKHIYRTHEADLPHECRYCSRRFVGYRSRYIHEGYAHPERFVRKQEQARGRMDANLRKSYGITADDYEAMLSEQEGVCAICGSDDPGTRDHRKRLHVDHDHETGRVRGLLCSPCNRLLGQASDSPKILRSAADYLEREGA